MPFIVDPSAVELVIIDDDWRKQFQKPKKYYVGLMSYEGQLSILDHSAQRANLYDSATITRMLNDLHEAGYQLVKYKPRT